MVVGLFYSRICIWYRPTLRDIHFQLSRGRPRYCWCHVPCKTTLFLTFASRTRYTRWEYLPSWHDIRDYSLSAFAELDCYVLKIKSCLLHRFEIISALEIQVFLMRTLSLLLNLVKFMKTSCKCPIDLILWLGERGVSYLVDKSKSFWL